MRAQLSGSREIDVVMGRASKKLTRSILLVLVLFSYGWRVHKLGEQSLWRDEIDAIYFALRDLRAVLSMFTDVGQNGALYFLALRPWLRLMGTTEFVLRYPSVLFGILAIPLFWQVSRKLAGRSGEREQDGTERKVGGDRWRLRLGSIFRATMGDAAVMAAILLAINPYHSWYSQDGKMYALITLLALAAIWFWLRGIDKGGWWPWICFFFTVTIAIYTHLLMILLIPLFIIWFFIAWPQSRHRWKHFLVTLAVLTLPYLPLLWWQWDLLVADRQLTALTYIPLQDIIQMVFFYQSNNLFQPPLFLYALPLLVLGLFGAVRGSRVYSGSSLQRLAAVRRHLLVIAWLALPLVMIYAVSLRQPVFLPRYLIWIMPAALLLISLGLNLIWKGKAKLSQPLAIALVIYVITYWSFIGWNEKKAVIKADLRSAVKFIDERRLPDELIIFQIPHLQHAYAYYTSEQGANPFDRSEERLGWWDVGLSPSSQLSDDEARIQVEAMMPRKSFGAADIWVFLSEEELSDPRNLMLEWLDSNYILRQHNTFHRAQVRHYQRE